MKKFRVLLHKIPAGLLEGIWYGIRHPVSGGIALATLSRYTHVEIWTPNMHVPCRDGDEFGLTMDQFYPAGTCYTSTLRGEYDGACKRPASEVLKNPERWDYLEYECEDEDYDKMIAAMEKAVKENRGYDKKLIVLWWYKAKRVYDKAKYICTEFVQMALIAVKRFRVPEQVAWLKYELLRNKPLTPKAFAKILPGTIRSLA